MLIPVKISAYPPLSQTWNEIQITHWSSHSDSSCNGGVWNLLLLLLLLLLSRFSHVWLCGPHRRQPTRLPRPWDSPGRNTGVGCHFLLQCMKVKSESEIAQSCLTLQQPLGLQPTRLLPWDFPGKSTGVGCHYLLHWNLPNLVQILTLLLKMLYHWAILPTDSVI